jgi:hypothetical protein
VIEILDTVAGLPAGDAAARLIQADARRRLGALRSGTPDDFENDAGG